MMDELNPTAADLAAIERQWPLIEAEMDVIDALISIALVDPYLCELDRRRLRRAENRVARQMCEFLALNDDAEMGDVA